MGRNTESLKHQMSLMEAQIKNLERQVEFLLRINGLDLAGLRTASDDDLLKLYQDAAQLLAVIQRGIDLEIIERWSEYFLQLSEMELIRLQPIVSFDHTWEPFFLLCVKMMTQVRQNKLLPEKIRIQQLYALLDRGRKNLREAAVVMCRKFPGTLTTKGRTILKDAELLAGVS